MRPDVLFLSVAMALQLLASWRLVNQAATYAPALAGDPPKRPFDSWLYPPAVAAFLDRQEWLGVLAWLSYLAILLRQVPGFDTPLDLTPAFGAVTQRLVETPHQLIVNLPDAVPLVLSIIALIRARASVANQFHNQRRLYAENARLRIGRTGTDIHAPSQVRPDRQRR